MKVRDLEHMLGRCADVLDVVEEELEYIARDLDEEEDDGEPDVEAQALLSMVITLGGMVGYVAFNLSDASRELGREAFDLAYPQASALKQCAMKTSTEKQ